MCKIKMNFQGYIKNINEYREDISSNFFAQFISNFTLSVNTFFLLSAALTSYSWFSAAKKLEGMLIKIFITNSISTKLDLSLARLHSAL